MNTEITREQISKLSDEAGEHGDMEQVEICRRALDGDADAVAECQRAIDRALAQQ